MAARQHVHDRRRHTERVFMWDRQYLRILQLDYSIFLLGLESITDSRSSLKPKHVTNNQEK